MKISAFLLKKRSLNFGPKKVIFFLFLVKIIGEQWAPKAQKLPEMKDEIAERKSFTGGQRFCYQLKISGAKLSPYKLTQLGYVSWAVTKINFPGSI